MKALPQCLGFLPSEYFNVPRIHRVPKSSESASIGLWNKPHIDMKSQSQILWFDLVASLIWLRPYRFFINCSCPVQVICLDISVELNRIETVYIGFAREQWGIIKRDLQCDIEWPSSFECHAVRYVLLQEGSLVDCIRKISLNWHSKKLEQFRNSFLYYSWALYYSNYWLHQSPVTDSCRLLWSNGIFIELRSIKLHSFKLSHVWSTRQSDIYWP